MATSGTAAWNPTLVELFEEAFERAGISYPTGYDITSIRRSFNFMVAEVANRGIVMFEIEQKTLALSQGVASYALPADTIDVLEGTIRTYSGQPYLQSDLVISRTSFDTYVQLPDKLTQGQPTQFAILRETAGPTVYFYPIPDDTQPYVFYYYRLRRIQDAGTNPAFTADYPFRYLDALAAGLAHRIASKRIASLPLVPSLKAAYEEALELAMSEDRERASVMLVPYVTQLI